MISRMIGSPSHLPTVRRQSLGGRPGAAGCRRWATSCAQVATRSSQVVSPSGSPSVPGLSPPQDARARQAPTPARSLAFPSLAQETRDTPRVPKHRPTHAGGATKRPGTPHTLTGVRARHGCDSRRPGTALAPFTAWGAPPSSRAGLCRSAPHRPGPPYRRARWPAPTRRPGRGSAAMRPTAPAT